VTHVTSGSVIPVTRARVTPTSRYPVTCVTEGLKRPTYRHEPDNAQNLEVLGADGSGSIASPSECDALPAGAVQITVTRLDNLLLQRITALSPDRASHVLPGCPGRRLKQRANPCGTAKRLDVAT
jgi:hypothetical protein